MVEKRNIDEVKSLKINLVSPDKIVNEWSSGEVYNFETLNYRTLKPEFGGLFCERIFGPMKDYECSCGKYKKSTYRGNVCENCGVDIVSSKVRRQRMGHIKLVNPVVSPLFKKYIAILLGESTRLSDLDSLINYRAYIVTKSNNKQLPAGTIIDKNDVARLEDIDNVEVSYGTIGLQEFLKNYDIDKEIKKVKAAISKIKRSIKNNIDQEKTPKNQGEKLRKLNEHLELLINFKNSGNKPEWLVMTVIPVIPADLRPLVQLGSGRNVVSGINELYRKVIIRNQRLSEMIKLGSPRLLLNDERVSLQNAVNDLFDNSKNNENALNKGKKIQKSLVEQLKGKQGRFRQNLLGKRVDFSGRSVIVVGPDLKLNECGLPKEMALELFKPIVIGRLIAKKKAPNMGTAKKKIENRDEEVWEILEEVVRENKVLLNRAPTLHRLGIQAFQPKLVEGKAIRLSPLVCAAYNADFDGDQMAVHLPLSKIAQEEATKLMLASNNILNPKDGQPIVTPSQDMILGNYYITMEDDNKDVHIFKDEEEAMMAYETRLITLHDRIFIKADKVSNAYLGENLEDKLLFTTIGKYIFNHITPNDYPYINEPSNANLQQLDEKYLVKLGTNLEQVLKDTPINQPVKKGFLSDLIYDVFEKYDINQTATMLDDMKALGFKYSALSGISISYADVPSVEKQDILDEAQAQVNEWNELYQAGLITENERYQKITQTIWTDAREEITERLLANLEATNNIFMMSDSGARGNRSNFTQLGAMRGLMAAPNGRIIELPVKSSFKEGLSVLEYFISSHGARKGLADTALKTADSGYLTRRLVDVAQDVVITEEDCHTYDYDVITDMMEGDEILVPFKERIVGRCLQQDVFDKKGNVLFETGHLITEADADQIVDLGINELKIRTVFSCKAKDGICRKCYGRDLSNNNLVSIGEAVGIVSAQSIGEPGTQLTMRTFHTGGVAGADITQGLPRVVEIFEAGNPKGKAILTPESGKVDIDELAAGFEIKIKKGKKVLWKTIVPHGIKIKYQTGDIVERGQELTEGSIYPRELLEYKGVDAVRNYILKEIQKVYRLQGVAINDKHVEIIVSQMMKYVRVTEPGDTGLITGELIRPQKVYQANTKAISKGKEPCCVNAEIMGIKKSSLETESFLSAASFQETAKTLSNAIIRGKVDPLYGIKENVIVGKLIPAGTGRCKNYKGVRE